MLSKLEIEVLQNVASGRKLAGSAEKRGRSYETERKHMRKIIQKLKASNQAHAVSLGIGMGLIYADKTRTVQ